MNRSTERVTSPGSPSRAHGPAAQAIGCGHPSPLRPLASTRRSARPVRRLDLVECDRHPRRVGAAGLRERPAPGRRRLRQPRRGTRPDRGDRPRRNERSGAQGDDPAGRHRNPAAAQPRFRPVDGRRAGRSPHALPDRLDGDPASDHGAVAAAGRRAALARRQAVQVPPAATRGRPDHAADAGQQHLRLLRLDPGQRTLRRRPGRRRLQAVVGAGTARGRLRPRHGLRPRHLPQLRAHELCGPRPGDRRGHRALGSEPDKRTGAEAARPARDRDLATAGDAGAGPALLRLRSAAPTRTRPSGAPRGRSGRAR